MKTIAKKYNKTEFLKYLIKNNVSDNIVFNFNELPEVIERNGNVYDIYINLILYIVNPPYCKYELNYYSENIVEFLFTFKAFDNIEQCVNNIKCDIINTK